MSLLDLGVGSFARTKMHYLFLLSPDAATKEQIAQARKYVEEMMEISLKKGFLAHISILDFEVAENDQKIIDTATKLLATQKRFTLEIAEASKFDHTISETIAAVFKNPQSASDLHYHLSLAFDRKPKSNFTPHITIAKEIPKTVYNLSLALSSFVKDKKVECDTLVVLRKPVGTEGEKVAYTRIAELELLG